MPGLAPGVAAMIGFDAGQAQGESGKYWCRQCGRSGDAIQYLRDYRHMTYPEACQYLGREPAQRPPVGGGRPPGKPAWEPRACSAPGDLWQAKPAGWWMRRSIIFGPHRHEAVLDFLMKTKGLTGDTIKEFSLGWLPADRWDAAPAWGLAEVLKDNGKPKRLWFPKGVTIPLLQGGQVVRVRIRRPDGEPRYYVLRGSEYPGDDHRRREPRGRRGGIRA